ncbi:FLU1-II [Auriculariales sp. MPI-PUGE-AT-0066]|nr:FLU1-II [Auriculariales sp. MPI-PUGE-AT-0066]
MSLSVADLELLGIRYVRIIWVDLINWTRMRVVPLAAFYKLLQRKRPGVRLTEASLGLVFLNVAEGFGSTGEYLYVLDPATIRLCPYAPGHASVMGWFQKAVPGPDTSLTVPLCPRGLLQRVVAQAQQSIRPVTFRMGFEIEVIYLNSVIPMVTPNDYSWSLTKATPAGSKISEALEETANALREMGIELEMYHGEAAPGQYELVLAHLPPLEAVDALVAARETIWQIASDSGSEASQQQLQVPACPLGTHLTGFAGGSGLHVHISVASQNPSPPVDLPSAPGFTQMEAMVLQGILDHLPAVCAISLPTEASYARMTDGIWSGGTYATWGRENRESAVRLCGEEGGYHLEIRANDGTACPYTAMAALLSAGVIGVLDRKKLVTKNCELSAHLLTEEERRALGITRRLPLTLEEARQNLVNDGRLIRELGQEFVKAHLAVNKTLQESLWDEDPAIALTRLVDHY